MSGNQNNPVRRYEKQYAGILSTVFSVKHSFSRALAPIQTKDGVQENEEAFSVKTNATPVVVNDTYLKGVNDAMGDGSGKKSRFGDITEVKYTNTPVNYDYELTIHEGIDRYTVNNDVDAAIADRLKLQSEAQVLGMNARIGKYMNAAAGKSLALADFSEDKLKKLFNDMRTYYVNLGVRVPIVAYVRPEVLNALVDMTSTNTSKGSSVSMDDNGLQKYKGFILEETPAQDFPEGTLGIFSPDGIVIPFVGISTARVIETEDFDGVKLQAAGKGGTYTLDDNKKAIAKITGIIV
ncbi:phage capsid protein [Streptococcus suis]|uniref:phage capsid protein n=1 Tax=Streptococcus suis TaxID=1307 RepID=UPI000CF39305|nr:phage capsid protein [Streptococcus suis]MBS8093964.1 phage capsid protein [Streptococcus suis]MCO8189642.1 phage capsid protein [Streptococcus suis]MCO8233869.1 phage capsid protein [Streptococcus suis]HEM3474058.1 phage capsid protein [Streptococcus suis]HEM3501206.1 phage capsid protein [Streptococcus suis]